MASPPLDRVARAPLLLDAAMGTRLIAQGLDLGRDDPSLWNEARPDAVRATHATDVGAGSDALFTNTFGANRTWLARFGLAREVAALNRRGVDLARAAGPDRLVLGSIGPTAVGEGPGPLREQAEALLDAGVDGLVLETFRHAQALAALVELGEIGRPIWVGLFDWPEPIPDAMAALVDAGAAAVGLNCTADGAAIDRFLDAIGGANAPNFWLKPSGGMPGEPPLADEAFRTIARRVAALGRGAMGGCCGTTDHHLRLIRRAWEDEGSPQRI